GLLRHAGADPAAGVVLGARTADPGDLALRPERDRLDGEGHHGERPGDHPGQRGSVIRRTCPPLTEERRKELIKLVHHRGEEGRVAVRNIRRHSKEELEKLERDGGISEDDLVRSEKELQKLTDKHISDIDEVVAHKDAELKEI